MSPLGMVLPGDALKVNIRHIGMRDGNIIMKIVTLNNRGEKVLEGTADTCFCILYKPGQALEALTHSFTSQDTCMCC